MARRLQICSQWREAADTDPKLLEYKASRGWWSTLASLNLTLLITREYEHLVIAASVENGRPRLSFMPVPHPSGLAVDRTTIGFFLLAPETRTGFHSSPGTIAPSETRCEGQVSGWKAIEHECFGVFSRKSIHA